MNSSIKAPYSSPSAKVLEVKTEGTICGNTATDEPDYNGFGSEEEW